MNHGRIVDMSEEDLLNTVLDYAKSGGWLATHFRPAKTEKGWRTALSGNKGFPDLVLVHAKLERCIFAELKSQKGYAQKEQKLWLESLRAAGQETYLWKPSDLKDIRHILLGHKLHREPEWS